MIPIHNYLIVSAICQSRSDAVNELSRACAQCGCNLLNLSVNTLGTEMTAILFMSGNWGAIAKMEAVIPSIEQRLGLTTMVRRTSESTIHGQWMTYNLQLVAIDKPGILNGLSEFLYKASVPIEDISAHTYQTATGTRMVSMTLKIKVPETMHLASLREKLIGYCDDNNLDAYIEPFRH